MTSPLRTPPPWFDPLTGYTRWLRGADYPHTTERLRLYHLKRFATTTESDPSTVTTDDLLDYLGTHQWASSTRHSNRTTLRSFFGWMHASGRRSDNPAALLPKIRQQPGTPRPIPEQILRDAIAGVGERERLMLLLGATGGLRAGEISRVNVADLMGERGAHSLLVHGKGRKQRVVPLADSMARDILEVGSANPGGWLFPGQIDGHLSDGYVSKLMSRNLPDGWTAHTLRHRFASTAYAGSRDLRAVQELLGHTNVATTQIYTAVPDDSVRAAVMLTQLAA